MTLHQDPAAADPRGGPADDLDVPVGTVRSRLHRARLQLKDQLKAVVQMD